MAIGDIDIDTFTIGGLDLNDRNSVDMVELSVVEDILNPYGPIAEVKINDFTDALGKNKINGKEDITLSFKSSSGGSSVTFKFKPYQPSNLDDRSASAGSTQRMGSGKSKMYTFKMVSPEMINAQGNYVQKSFETQTSQMVKDILQNSLKTDKQIEIGEETDGQIRRVFNREHPHEALKNLNNVHIGTESQSSCFTTFVQCDGSNQKYIFTTFEKLFKQGPVATLKQNSAIATGGASESDVQNSILWFKPNESFNTLTRAKNAANETTYNVVTGKVNRAAKNPPPKFTLADGSGVYSGTSYDDVPPDQRTPVHTIHDPANNKVSNKIATAKTNRAAFLSHLAQNSAELEIPGNTNIKLGSMIELDVYKKAAVDNDDGESQINGKALVVGIKHKVKPLGDNYRYTMILRVAKGSYKEGGGEKG